MLFTTEQSLQIFIEFWKKLYSVRGPFKKNSRTERKTENVQIDEKIATLVESYKKIKKI